jgi:hypothetical protein
VATGDDVNTPVIALVGFISAILFFAIIVLLEVVFYWAETQQHEKDLGQPPQELATLMHNQQARLAEYRWVDENKGVVAIPIDRAMELVVADLSAATKPAPAKEGKR